MNRSNHTEQKSKLSSEQNGPFWLCGICFLAGCLFAVVYAGGVSSGDPVVEYLLDFQQSVLLTGEAAFGTWRLFGEMALFVVLSFLAGFSVFGVLLIPVFAFLRGFLISFSCALFIRLFGTGQMTALLILFGVEALFTVPCFFVISVGSFRSSLSLVRAYFFRAPADPAFRWMYFFRFFLCLIVVFAAVLLRKTMIERYLIAVFSP